MINMLFMYAYCVLYIIAWILQLLCGVSLPFLCGVLIYRQAIITTFAVFLMMCALSGHHAAR